MVAGVDLESLRRIAHGQSVQLMQQGARAVAILGSVARGDVGPGSDLDLWILTRGPRRIGWWVAEGVPVTGFFEPLERVLELPHLARIEWQQAKVLADPEGLFAQIAARGASAEARAYFEAGEAQALAHVRALHRMGTSKRGFPVGRIWALREAVQIAAGLEVLRSSGLLVAKVRHVERTLSAERFARWTEVLALDSSASALAPWMETLDGLEAELREHLRSIDGDARPLPSTAALRRKWEHGAQHEAVLHFRAWLDRAFLERCRSALGPLDEVAYLTFSCPEPIRQAFWSAHGLGPAPRQDWEALLPATEELLRPILGSGATRFA